MADQKTRPETTDPVKQRAERRQERIKAAAKAKSARVRVVPASDKMRSALRHPLGNVGFRAEGAADWPLDSYTKRRIKDGSVKLETENKAAAKQAPASDRPRPAEPQQAAPPLKESARPADPQTA